jgi:hypothetical protein
MGEDEILFVTDPYFAVAELFSPARHSIDLLSANVALEGRPDSW